METGRRVRMLTVLLLAFVTSPVSGQVKEHPPGANLTTPGLIELQGYPAEIHHATTVDGYILEMHRIPHGINDTASEGRPVAFLQHGLLSSSSDWLMNDPDKALAYMMADAGYDVWLGNFRGNTYSRRHTTLDPHEGIEYWEFSWDEMGMYDIPAMMDYVLQLTGQNQLYYVGFSMGTTTYLAMMSERPENNEKVRAAVLLAPPAYMEHTKGVFAWLAPYSNDLDMIFTLLGKGEFLPGRNVTQEWMTEFCDEESMGAELCYNLLFLICGPDSELLNKEYLPLVMAHAPAGTSVHTVNHYAQLIVSGGFNMYDFGLIGNQNHYGQNSPPDFNLTNVLAPVAVFWGANDWLATPEDVARLIPELPGLALNQRVPYDNFNHIDFQWAYNAHELVYYQLLDFLNEYGGPQRVI